MLATMLQNQNGVTDEIVLTLWESLGTSLVSLIGEEGFKALYGRSLHLAGTTYPWLADLPIPQGEQPRFSALAVSVHGRPLEEATAAMVLLLSTFTDVLSTLIGQQLTTNILRTAWGDAYEEAAQEISWPKK